ncbi:MAG: type II toxin-antitoxin system PemK/MazF family toxin [Paenibacillaceae bacterium]
MAVTGTVVRGSVVWIKLFPIIGHEQSGFRSAIVLSDGFIKSYTDSTLAFIVPITTVVKNSPFEVPVPNGIVIDSNLINKTEIITLTGVVLTDHARTVDLNARNAFVIGQIDPSSGFYNKVVSFVRAIIA